MGGLGDLGCADGDFGFFLGVFWGIEYFVLLGNFRVWVLGDLSLGCWYLVWILWFRLRVCGVSSASGVVWVVLCVFGLF